MKSIPAAAPDVSDAAVNTDEVSPPPPLKKRLPEVASNVNHDCMDTHEVPPPRQCPGIWSHGSVHEDRFADTLFETAAVGCVDPVHYLVIFSSVDPEQPGTNHGGFTPLEAAEFGAFVKYPGCSQVVEFLHNWLAKDQDMYSNGF